MSLRRILCFPPSCAEAEENARVIDDNQNQQDVNMNHDITSLFTLILFVLLVLNLLLLICNCNGYWKRNTKTVIDNFEIGVQRRNKGHQRMEININH